MYDDVNYSVIWKGETPPIEMSMRNILKPPTDLSKSTTHIYHDIRKHQIRQLNQDIVSAPRTSVHIYEELAEPSIKQRFLSMFSVRTKKLAINQNTYEKFIGHENVTNNLVGTNNENVTKKLVDTNNENVTKKLLDTNNENVTKN